jgi:hypothetical protein
LAVTYTDPPAAPGRRCEHPLNIANHSVDAKRNTAKPRHLAQRDGSFGQNAETVSIREEGRRERVKILSGTFSSIQGKMPRVGTSPGWSGAPDRKMAFSPENAHFRQFFATPSTAESSLVANSHSNP